MKIRDDFQIAIDIENIMKELYYNLYNNLKIKKAESHGIEIILRLLLKMVKAEDTHASILANFSDHPISKSTEIEDRFYNKFLDRYNNLRIISEKYIIDYDSKDVMNDIRSLILDVENKAEKDIRFFIYHLPNKLQYEIKEDIKFLDAYVFHDAALKKLTDQLQ